MSAYATTSLPIRPRHTDVARLFVIQPRIPAQQWASYLRQRRGIFCHLRLALHGIRLAMARLCYGEERASFAISSPLSCLVSIAFYVPFSAKIPMCFLVFSTHKVLF